MHLSLPRRRVGWRIWFPKISTIAVSRSLGLKRVWRVADEPTPDHTHPPLSPTGSSGWFENVKEPTHASLCQTVEPGKHCTAHWDRVPVFQRSAGMYVRGPAGLAYTVSGCLATHTVSLAHADNQTRLCDSVYPGFPQVQWHLLHIREGGRCSCLASGDRSPTGDGCDRPSPSSRYEDGVLQPLFHFTQERQWFTTGLGPACE